MFLLASDKISILENFLMALCWPPALGSNETDACGQGMRAWKHPRRDHADLDPIVSAQWVRVDFVVQCRRSGFVAGRVALSRRAVDLMRRQTGDMVSC